MLILTFNAGMNRYAIDSTRIVELVPKVDLRSIPHAPPFLAGLLAYRSKVIPVIDLGLLLADAPCHLCLSTRIILVNDAPGDQNRGNGSPDGLIKNDRPGAWDRKRGGNLLGLVAEQVNDLTYVQPEQISPTLVYTPDAPYLDAIVRTDQGIVQLIAVDRVWKIVLRGIPSGADLESPPGFSNEESSQSAVRDRESRNS